MRLPNPEQQRVLAALAAAGEITPTDLAEQMGVRQYVAGLALRRLGKSGFAVKAGKTRRPMTNGAKWLLVWRVTAEGEAVLAAYADALRRWPAPLTREMERILTAIQVDESTGCWLWPNVPLGNGYCLLSVDGVKRSAHRASYEAFVAPIPDGLVLDHLCRTPRCINPEHLEPVTQRENILRGVGLAAQNAAKSECVNGHPLSGPNLIIRADGARACRECKRQTSRRRYWADPEKHRAKALARMNDRGRAMKSGHDRSVVIGGER